MTLAAGGTAVAQLTQIAAQPSATLPPPPTIPPTAAPTPTDPPPTPTPAPCHWAGFVADVTAPDNSVFFPGETFTKIWRVSNIGACEWTPDYALVFASGDRMGGVSAVFLPHRVLPGEQVDLQVTLTAPEAPGIYRSNWLLRSPAGEQFGIGADAAQPLWVQIQVAQQPPAPRGAYDFALRACDAVWRSSTAALGCPGSCSRLQWLRRAAEPAVSRVRRSQRTGAMDSSGHLPQWQDHRRLPRIHCAPRRPLPRRAGLPALTTRPAT